MIQIQVTLCSDMGYKPMSAIIEIPSREAWAEHKQEYKQRGIMLICSRRHMSIKDLKKYGYHIVKTREYDKEKIDKENKDRYEQIKKERGWE